MAFSPISFLLGVGVACALPSLSRSFRPLAVEATAIGLGLVEDARRMVAEQMETLEDIAAEARARREQMSAAAEVDEAAPDEDEFTGPAAASANGRGRRRAGRSRARAT